MKKNRAFTLTLIAGLLLIIFFNMFYFLYIQRQVRLFFEGKAELWFTLILDLFYPRLAVEKQRFPVDFFIQKSREVFFRANFVSLILLAFGLGCHFSSLFREKLRHYTTSRTPLSNVKMICKLYALLGLYLIYDWIFYFYQLQKGQFAYAPVFLLKVLHLSYPPYTLLFFLYCLAVISAIFLFLLIRPLLFSLCFSLVFVFLQAYLYSFHKLDHTYATFTYASFLMPFLCWNLRNALKKKENYTEDWPLKGIQICIALAYFFSGLEKIFSGGIAWFHPDTLTYYLQLHSSSWGLWLSGQPVLCSILAGWSVVFELGFIWIIFQRKTVFLILPIGIFFHWGVFLFLDIGGWIHPWFLVYFFYINWTDIFSKLQQKSHL